MDKQKFLISWKSYASRSVIFLITSPRKFFQTKQKRSARSLCRSHFWSALSLTPARRFIQGQIVHDCCPTSCAATYSSRLPAIAAEKSIDFIRSFRISSDDDYAVKLAVRA